MQKFKSSLKNMQSNFSLHAFERVSGRLSMTHRELITVLNTGLVVNIGSETNSNRAHRLFYSELDKMCFVAIQDMKTGTIVTVLPIDYHQNISWAVSIDSQSEAKSLIVKQDANSCAKAEPPKVCASSFKMTATIVDEIGSCFKTINLGSWPCEPYKYCVDVLVEDDFFVKVLAQRLTAKLADIEEPINFVRTISIKLGQKGDLVFFPVYRRNEYFNAEVTKFR